MSDQEDRPVKTRVRVASEEDLKVLLGNKPTPDALLAADRKKGEIARHLQGLLQVRVPDPSGDQTMKISFKEFVTMRQDPEFEAVTKYGPNLVLYADGTPRKTPIRQLLQNEVGKYRGKIVCIKDEDPDGIGTVHQVAEQIGEKAE